MVTWGNPYRSLCRKTFLQINIIYVIVNTYDKRLRLSSKYLYCCCYCFTKITIYLIHWYITMTGNPHISLKHIILSYLAWVTYITWNPIISTNEWRGRFLDNFIIKRKHFTRTWTILVWGINFEYKRISGKGKKLRVIQYIEIYKIMGMKILGGNICVYTTNSLTNWIVEVYNY